MKKIPTLFERVFEKGKIVDIKNKVHNGVEWVLAGEGVATVKYDGSCCAIINGGFYKRYDAKNGKPIPEGAIKCQEKPDEITGHMPCWVAVNPFSNENKWFIEAYNNTIGDFTVPDGTYEAIGRHFQGNPYELDNDILIPHGEKIVDVERTFEGIRKYLKEHYVEGLVFWKDGEPKCKIKRTDFGFEWNDKLKS